jgi:hypothetical protein
VEQELITDMDTFKDRVTNLLANLGNLKDLVFQNLLYKKSMKYKLQFFKKTLSNQKIDDIHQSYDITNLTGIKGLNSANVMEHMKIQP